MRLRIRAVWLASLLSLATTPSAFAAPAISPILHDLGAGAVLERNGLSGAPLVGRTIDLIVSGGMSDADLEAAGAVIGTRLSNGTRTIRIPVSRFAELQATPGLASITAAHQRRLGAALGRHAGALDLRRGGQLRGECGQQRDRGRGRFGRGLVARRLQEPRRHDADSLVVGP